MLSQACRLYCVSRHLYTFTIVYSHDMLNPLMVLSSIAFVALAVSFYFGHSPSLEYAQAHHREVLVQEPGADPKVTGDALPFTTRVHWMRRANAVLSELSSPCPFAAFGSVIVNHSDARGLGDVVCIGLNSMEDGNPTLHGIAFWTAKRRPLM
jgi:hypothetical protein